MRYLIFKLGSKTLALPGEKVQEVVRLFLLGPAPGKAYKGSVSWRGKTLAVLAPDALGVTNASPGFAIVAEIRGVPVGFPADKVAGLLQADEIENAAPGSDDWLAGIVGKDKAWLIDPDRVITLREIGEAALILGETEFLRFCAKTIGDISKRRKSRELERAAMAITKELEKDEP